VRIAFLADGTTPNAAYRSIGPMTALAERGHEVRQLGLDDRDQWHALLRWCELLHLHRVCDGGAVELARAAKAAGAAVVWDDDDDVTRSPRGTAGHRDAGGLKGVRRLRARSQLFEQVDLVTTPSELLAERFREGGAPEVRVIENYVIDRMVRGGGTREDGVVRIGWVAAEEHRFDLDRVPFVDALARLLETHPHVRVTTVGVRLPLPDERYTHLPPVPFSHLLGHVAGFDVGLAPLSADWEINRARSNVKLKEYAAVGVPWLASPIGPYAGHGEREGGRLVADDGWHEALARLVERPRERRKLAKRAAKWGRGQMLSRNVGCWERELAHALSRARARGEAA
jgi:glycosyltransferase involved in cell wall biosynthesis